MKAVRQDGIIVTLLLLKIKTNCGRKVGDSLEEMKAADRIAKYKSFLHSPNLCRVSAMCEALLWEERETFYNDHVAFIAVISL